MLDASCWTSPRHVQDQPATGAEIRPALHILPAFTYMIHLIPLRLVSAGLGQEVPAALRSLAENLLEAAMGTVAVTGKLVGVAALDELLSAARA